VEDRPVVLDVLPAEAPPLDAVSEAERIVSLDVLRGVALLGILVMNIQCFAMIEAAYENPTAYGDLQGANYGVWLLSHVLADQKFMTIFSLLFGAGIVLMAGRREQAGGRPAVVHYRRMAALAIFGLVHAYLFWYGDILFSYALCGLVVYLFRKVPTTWQLVLGLLSLAVPSCLYLLCAWTVPYWPEETVQEISENWFPSAQQVADELAAYRGSWVQAFEHRRSAALFFETVVFLFYTAWRAGGLMLLGMALFKLGFFSARRSPWTYLALIAAALGLGIPTILYGVHRNNQAGWDPIYGQFSAVQYNYWASLLVSLGWVGLVMLVCQKPRLRPFTRPFAAVGQMALTNYFLHTLICTTIFYGYGFGLFGQVERVGQIGIVFAIWTVQLIAAPLWLRYFLFGPAEWLWRLLTYWKVPPLRRRTTPAFPQPAVVEGVT
jgi:uncharacterized protein